MNLVHLIHIGSMVILESLEIASPELPYPLTHLLSLGLAVSLIFNGSFHPIVLQLQEYPTMLRFTHIISFVQLVPLSPHGILRFQPVALA